MSVRFLLPVLSLLVGSTLGAQTPAVRATQPAAAKPQPAVARPRPTPAPPPVLEGIVRGPDQKPIAKARVVARSSVPTPDEVAVSARTDAQGRFKLALGSRRLHRVHAEAPGLAGRTLEDVAPGTPLTIDLTAGGAIEGVVRDGDTNEPVAEASVETRNDTIGTPDEPDAGRVQTATDAEGRFKLTGVAAGRHVVSARARGRGHASRSAIPVGGRVELLLQPTATIHGSVTGPDGKPIAGAVVTLLGLRRPPRSERTDARGRYEIAGLAGGLYDVAVRAPDLAPGVVSDVALETRGEVQVDVSLRLGARVVGRLVDASERSLAGRVLVGEIAGHTAPYVLGDLLRAEAGPDGRFALKAVPVGDHALGTDVPGQGPQRVEFSVGPVQREVDLGDVRVEAGLTIRGHVRDRAGQPVADATVEGSAVRVRANVSPRARTDAEGAFALGGLEPLTYRLAARAAGFGSASTRVEPGPDLVELILDTAGSIVGRVVDDRGQAVDSFLVTARPADDEESGAWSFDDFEASDGRFALDDVTPGRYVVSVEAPERASAKLPPVKVGAGGATDVGTVKLTAGGTIRGTVVDADGASVAGARIRIVARADQGNRMVVGSEPEIMSDRSGAFEAKGLDAGSVDLAAYHPSHAPSQPLAIVVDPDRPTTGLRLVLGEGGRIEGSVRRRDGSPMAGALVTATASGQEVSSGSDPMLPAQADGSFTFEHVRPGPVRVMVMAGAGRGSYRSAQVREVDVRDGETTRVEIVNREILLTGRVTRGGTPGAGLRVDVYGDQMVTFGGRGPSVPASAAVGPERMRAVTREDGGFEMIVDEPGSLRFAVASADGRVRLPMRRVQVPDAETFAVDLAFNGVPVAGIVVDKETEAPLAYANVFASARAPRTEGMGGSATAGPDGRFHLELEPAEYTVGAATTKPGYARADVKVSVGPDGVSDLRVPLPRGLRIAGKALDPSGRGVAGAAVTAHQPSVFVAERTQTLADGSFEIRGLTSGEYILSASSAAKLFAIQRNVAAGTLEVPVRLQPGGRVVVQVVTAGGQAVAGATISVAKVDGLYMLNDVPSRATNAQGTAELIVPAGRVTLATGGSVATVDVASGETQQVRITLEAR